MGLIISENYVNATKKCGAGFTKAYETRFNKISDLFVYLKQQYGRCISSMYIDENKKSKKIGWVFRKSQQYDDCNDYFEIETWVAVHKCMPEHIIEQHYKEL